MTRPAAFVFDAYGTLLDVHSIIESGRTVTDDPQALSALWRQKQLEYTWLIALMDRYEDFWNVTEAALRFSLKRLGITADEASIRRLMDAYLSLAAFPEVHTALEAMTGTPLGILSNGTSGMLAAAVRSSGLESHFTHVLSADTVRTYKPASVVYALGTRAFSLPAEEIVFVSSNAWDVAGAKAFGYRTCWCNRTGAAMEKLGLAPDYEVTSLDEIPQLFK